jgi:hypothetical protein
VGGYAAPKAGEGERMKNKAFALKLAGLAASIALCGGIAVAQYGPPPANGYEQAYHEGGHANVGARMGWQAGFAQGQSDREHGHSFRPTHTDQYKDVPRAPEDYPKGRFKHEYRDAFVKGYAHGYGR